MKFFYKKFYVVLLFIIFDRAFGEVVVSIHSGEWNSLSTWSSHAIPLPSDSVVIDHYVIFTDSIVINSIGDLLIDSCGTLCGNNCLHGHFTNFGRMYIGCFNITEASYNYDTIISNNTSGSGVYTGYLVTYNYISIGPNMPPCVVPPNQRTVGACAKVYSEITESLNLSHFSLSPNPATSQIIIETETSSPFDISLFDITGKCIHTIKSNTGNHTSINVEYLLAGYYFLKIADNNFTTTKRFVIAR